MPPAKKSTPHLSSKFAATNPELTIRTSSVYYVDMKTVSVAVLKQELSRYLHLVEDGEDLVVTAHRRPVARVIPHPERGLSTRLPSRKPAVLGKLNGVRLSPGRTAVDTLLEERSRR